VRHIAAYDWHGIHSATPQRNGLTCHVDVRTCPVKDRQRASEARDQIG
jgi:hypothetical protein